MLDVLAPDYHPFSTDESSKVHHTYYLVCIKETTHFSDEEPITLLF